MCFGNDINIESYFQDALQVVDVWPIDRVDRKIPTTCREACGYLYRGLRRVYHI